MKYDNGNLCISWKTYNNPTHLFYKEYWIEHEQSYDCFLLIGPLHLRWWIEVSREVFK